MTKKLLTIKDVLEKKNLIKKLPINYYSSFFDAEIEVKSDVSKDELIEILNEKDDGNYRKFLKLIYLCCPLFKSKEIKEAFTDIKEPYDIIDKVFCDNVGEVANLGAFIVQKFGFIGEDDLTAIKKQ